MYCVFNATTLNEANQGSPLGWPFESGQYGYFCDQRDKSLFMLSHGLFNLLTILGLYLATVLHFGPKFMANRKPFEIMTSIRLYNFSMILVNLYLMRRALPIIDNGRNFFNCKGALMDPAQANESAILTELYILSRVADFLDTVWFVLRKKQSHISFLHVFHHSYVPSLVYIGSRWVPISPSVMSLPFLNGGIHVVMYTYYLMATFPSLRQHLWWKRYLTGMQMAQFVIVLIYNVLGFFFYSNYCDTYQIRELVGSIVSATIFLVLFHSFYKRTYVQTGLENCLKDEHNAGKQHKV